MKKKSQASIISIVLIILLVMVSIVIVWNVVNPMVEESTEQSSTTPITNSVEIKNVKLFKNGDVNITIQKMVGEAELTELKFVFYDKDEENTIITITNNLPKELDTREYSFKSGEIGRVVEKVSVIPIFDSITGIETFEKKGSIKRNSTGGRIRI